MDDNDHISDLDIQALVDGAVDEPEERALRQAISKNPQHRKRLRDLERQKELLKIWWRNFRQEH